MSTRAKAQEVDYNDPKQYDSLSDEVKEALQYWIQKAIKPAKSVDPGNSSYGMKHRFEDEGFSISHGSYKGAMLAAGYVPVDASERNWCFKCRPTFTYPKKDEFRTYTTAHLPPEQRAELKRLVKRAIASYDTNATAVAL